MDIRRLLKRPKGPTHQDFRYILYKMPGYVYWKNTQSKYIGCNERLARFSGLQSPLEIVGKTDYDFYWGNKQADQFVKDDQWIIATGKTLINEHTLPQKNPGGVPLYVRTEKMPFYDKTGGIIGVLAIACDISHKKQWEQALLEAKNKAEEINRMKTAFIRNMEHDIRTPFNALLGMSSYLHEIETDASKKAYLLDIKASAKELLDYCNSIIYFSQTERETPTIAAKEFAPYNLFHNVVAMELPAAQQKNLVLQAIYDDCIPTTLIGDAYRMQRILINLISNAIKFTEKGKVTVQLSLVKATAHFACVRFCVEDTGIGIPQDKQDCIFERFVRLSTSNQKHYKRLGLGLGLVQNFIQEMAGEIEIVSDLGKGTRFVCTFSFGVPEVQSVVEKDADTTLLTPSAYLPQKGLRTLVVEDTKIAQKMASIIFKRLGVCMDIADTGNKAIALFKEKHYDIIFMDLGLPDKNGLAVIRILRDWERTKQATPTPIVILSAHSCESYKADFEELALQGFLCKPLTLENAQNILEKTLKPTKNGASNGESNAKINQKLAKGEN